MKYAFALLFTLMAMSSFSQKGTIDVQHYIFDLGLSDASDTLKGKALIRFKASEPLNSFDLDLTSVNKGKGMKVQRVLLGDGPGLTFKHNAEKLTLFFKDVMKPGEERTVTVFYSGIPSDGLIISKNRFSERTFFADNWPNRAHNWIPCVDVPGDKASFEFIVRAPEQYTVVSNGKFQPGKWKTTSAWEMPRDGKLTWHFHEGVSLPTKVMVIGAARFSYKRYDDSPEGMSVGAYIFTQDSARGFHDYAAAPSILKFFSEYIGPYPFHKLDNVQSKTIFGGMENAGVIFYAETSVTGKGEVEDLLAHEIAHQWFGDMASEKTFTHLWLSEGFATYLTNIYLEQKYGEYAIRKRMEEDRRQVIEFAAGSKQAVVDSTSKYMDLLNANSYQKGGWILHMLRNNVGDSIFRKILQAYYETYKGSNADSRDFEAVAEEVSGKELTPFFEQWLYRPGIPVLQMENSIGNGGYTLHVNQVQAGGPFHFPLEVMFILEDGETFTKTFDVTEKESTFKIPVKGNSLKFTIDPNVKLLYQMK